MKSVLSVLSIIGAVHGAQIISSDGESMWLASIGDDPKYNCNKMTAKISDLLHNHRRMLGSDVPSVLEGLDGGEEYDCFVLFSSPDNVVVELVRDLDGVDSVVPDEEVSMLVEWGQDRSDQDSLPLDNGAYLPTFTGAGQCLYVIDTGILPTHVDFGGRAFHGADFIEEGDPVDQNGHGTHCASIAGGGTYGIAPGVDTIKGVKVLGRTGSGSSAGVIKGIQWAVKDAGSKTSVISLSLGGVENSALDTAVENAAKKHIVVVAAGNSNTDACGSSPAGAGGKVLTIGSTKKDDFRSSFSNYGECVDMFGPGSDIKAAYIGSGNTNTNVLSGTSMATPYIAGIALQALEKNGGKLASARNDLIANAIGGVVKDAGIGSTNRLGRIFEYTGPPTMPTMQPTMQMEPLLCSKNTNTGLYNTCVDFKASEFGTYGWMDDGIQGPVMFSKENPELCKESSDDFTGKIALVKRGGCFFFDKVKNAEKQGAKAVLIWNDSSSVPFSPGYNGDDDTKLASAMIHRDTKNSFKDGDMLRWGSPDMFGDTPPATGVPTMRPTKVSPTMRPTKAPVEQLRCDLYDEATCRKRKKCRWDGWVCYIKPKYT